MKIAASLAPLLQAFFTDRLMRERDASPHTIASYRDSFRQLLHFAAQRLRKPPSQLQLDDLDAPFIGSFLHHLEAECGNTARTRNQRLAAIRSFFRYVSFLEPAHSALIQRVLSLPNKRQDRALIDFLTRPEAEAILEAPDQSTWLGCRDHALLLVTIQTGLRAAELTGLCCQDVHLRTGPHIRCYGKGRKERCTPLTQQTVKVLRDWLRERGGAPCDPLFPNARRGRLSVNGFQYLLKKHLAVARERCPSLRGKRVSPHVLRHTTAMELLQAGIDRAVIALWLGHESVETTQIYLDANLALKERALARTTPVDVPSGRYRPDDELMRFLQSL